MKPKTLSEARSMFLGKALSRVHSPVFEEPERAQGFLPIVMHGGIGDHVCSLAALDGLVELIGNLRVYSACPETVHYFRPEYGDMLRTEPFPGYDHWLTLETVPRFRFDERTFKSLPDKVDSLYVHSRAFQAGELSRWVSYQPFFDHELWRELASDGLTRSTVACAALGLKRERWTRSAKAPVDLEPFITVHDGYDTTQGMVPYRATKTWSLREWARLVKHVKERYDGLMVVQLGGSTSRPIPGVDVNLSGRLKLHQSLNVLGRSRLHVDGDSGLVHCAHAMGVRSVVLFGPTPGEFFGYADNYNVGPNECGGCGWVNEDWMNDCPLYDSPRCMDSIGASRVFAEVKEELDDAWLR